MGNATKERRASENGGVDRLFPRAVEVRANRKKALLVPFTVEDLDGIGEILQAVGTEFRGREEIRPDELVQILLSGKMVRKVLRFLLLRVRADADGKARPVNPELRPEDLGAIELIEAAEIVERAIVDLDLAAIVGKVAAGMDRFRRFAGGEPSPPDSRSPSSPTS